MSLLTIAEVAAVNMG